MLNKRWTVKRNNRLSGKAAVISLIKLFWKETACYNVLSLYSIAHLIGNVKGEEDIMVYKVDYQGNWMQLILRANGNGFKVISSVSNMDDDDIRLYAETDIEPEIDERGYENDEAMYNSLKEEIVKQAIKNGIDTNTLRFWYD